MPEINDGETVEIQGSAKDPYILRNVGGVLSCSCPAWRNQSTPIERRTCKHLRQYCGEELEQERLGGEIPTQAARAKRTVAQTSAGTASASTAAQAGGPGILLAHSWEDDIDTTGWWMSEKLDGVRAYWDGQQFISRQGNVYLAPDWFIEDLPKDVHLDGELWLARKMFQRAVSIVRRQDKNDSWQEMTYLVFDAPLVDDVFEARMAYIAQLLDELQPKYCRPHPHERCNSRDHLLEELARVESMGGEGLMLRKPSSKYEVGRSSSLLKVKTFKDAEAKVIEHLPGTGKHKGRLGALAVELADGTKFSVGTGFSDAERNNPPPVGSIITFRYQELSDRGVPRFPSYVRLRTDIDKLAQEKLPAMVAPAPAPAMASNRSAAPITTKVPPATKSVVSSASAAPAAVATAATVATSPARMFEFVEGTASKFWEITLAGSEVIARFGRIGTAGQSKPKSFPSAAAAQRYYDELIEEKVGKGYVEIKGSGSGSSSSSADDDDDDDEDDDE